MELRLRRVCQLVAVTAMFVPGRERAEARLEAIRVATIERDTESSKDWEVGRSSTQQRCF